MPSLGLWTWTQSVVSHIQPTSELKCPTPRVVPIKSPGFIPSSRRGPDGPNGRPGKPDIHHEQEAGLLAAGALVGAGFPAHLAHTPTLRAAREHCWAAPPCCTGGGAAMPRPPFDLVPMWTRPLDD